MIAALLAGQGVEEVAGQYNLPKSTVGTWKKEIDQEHFEQLRTKKGERFADLLSNYLDETLMTLASQAIFFRNVPWLKKQSASELAVLHGVQSDKALRLLEAIERANAGEPQNSDLS